MIAKRFELLQQLIPTATSIALFVNPKNSITTRAETREARVFFVTVQDQLIDLAMHNKIPISIPQPEGVRKGALIGYGANTNDAFRELGVFAGRLLKGDRPVDLPVQRSVKIDLLINLKTAKALGLDVPPTLLARADEVIE